MVCVTCYMLHEEGEVNSLFPNDDRYSLIPDRHLTGHFRQELPQGEGYAQRRIMYLLRRQPGSKEGGKLNDK